MRAGNTVPEEGRTRRALLGGGVVLALLAFIKLLVHLLTAKNYGYFRDELYYIAASERLDLGYVDFPPFVALATALARATLGDSLPALALLPAAALPVAVDRRGHRGRFPCPLPVLERDERVAHARVLGGVRGEGGRGFARGVLDRAGRHHAAAYPTALARGALLLP